MAKEQESLTLALLTEEKNTVVLASPDRDTELDFPSDPSLKSQIEFGFNADYKIPDTPIRTMQIDISEEEINIREISDWLDCASRNSGIPRWIFLISNFICNTCRILAELFNAEKTRKYELMLDEIESTLTLLENYPFVGREIHLEAPP
nr:unnamed protein product [Callosobruchus analis]